MPSTKRRRTKHTQQRNASIVPQSRTIQEYVEEIHQSQDESSIINIRPHLDYDTKVSRRFPDREVSPFKGVDDIDDQSSQDESRDTKQPIVDDFTDYPQDQQFLEAPMQTGERSPLLRDDPIESPESFSSRYNTSNLAYARHARSSLPLTQPKKEEVSERVSVDDIKQYRRKVGMSFNAGGIRGYMSALILQQLERDMGIPANQFVDVFSGVSIGCLLGGMLAMGVSADDIVNLFETQSKQIFKPKYYYKWGIIPIKGPRYCSDSLYSTIHALVGDQTLKEVQSTIIGLATDMTDSTFPRGVVFSNLNKNQEDLKVVDIMMASSAAPSYFAQYHIDGQCYVDGGLSNCDPSLQCIIGLEHHTDSVFKDSVLINIGTGIYQGEPPTPDNKSTWNTFYLTHGLVSSISANQALTHDTAQQLYYKTGNFFTLDYQLDQHIALDDVNSLLILKVTASQVIASPEYQECLSMLKENQKKATRPY